MLPLLSRETCPPAEVHPFTPRALCPRCQGRQAPTLHPSHSSPSSLSHPLPLSCLLCPKPNRADKHPHSAPALLPLPAASALLTSGGSSQPLLESSVNDNHSSVGSPAPETWHMKGVRLSHAFADGVVCDLEIRNGGALRCYVWTVYCAEARVSMYSSVVLCMEVL